MNHIFCHQNQRANLLIEQLRLCRPDSALFNVAETSVVELSPELAERAEVGKLRMFKCLGHIIAHSAARSWEGQAIKCRVASQQKHPCNVT